MGMRRQRREQLLAHLDALHSQHGRDLSIGAGPFGQPYRMGYRTTVCQLRFREGVSNQVSTRTLLGERW
jgi:hypothetical protein